MEDIKMLKYSIGKHFGPEGVKYSESL